MFEQPPCPDGHGAECPERVCVDCGAAVLVDPPLTAPGAPPGRSAAGSAGGTEPRRAGSSPAASTRAVA
ncbi:hypothetical protein [Actinomadura opuntiae]|uniref:hypothetical protein n=1 Tax=Actinomadura sp. OS1-43 TaxID=604315 RepID=UPI00255B29ED|nr:hypothetical protein [Actinomadura sp. OS1-43]MDL4820125.1 hypothetical protein [Actinomadura sp. OS1-43]